MSRAGTCLEPADPGVAPVHHWRADHGAPVHEQPDASCLAALDDIEKVRYADSNDVMDADIDVHAAIGNKV